MIAIYESPNSYQAAGYPTLSTNLRFYPVVGTKSDTGLQLRQESERVGEYKKKMLQQNNCWSIHGDKKEVNRFYTTYLDSRYYLLVTCLEI